jgi:hypothetical protein
MIGSASGNKPLPQLLQHWSESVQSSAALDQRI